ncbi:MAG TPA: hypothetical protein VNK67_04490 [Burkholderiales bacterium]|nr:hypothetical protein [Burkholderiales bacterium]
MNLRQFQASLGAVRPPRGLAAPLRALWHEARGDWERAHRIVQGEASKAAMRVHAYLHRKEGDSENADYWYARAGEERPRVALEKEWETLVKSLLDEASRAHGREGAEDGRSKG